MLECLILGDSIAVGVHKARPECVAYVKSGINSRDFVNRYIGKDLVADTVVISLGSNDYPGIKTKNELTELRSQIIGKKVYWIMPAIKPEIQEIVEEVADKHGDWIIRIPHLSNDRVHPTRKGYERIGEIIK
jgi:lysophospholipase L1-like esterase